jgi:Spy/CpxP family protein refolding chaperone
MNMGGGMMGGLQAFAPPRLLERVQALGLSEGQVARLEAIKARETEAEEQAHLPAHAAMQSLRTELDAEEPDTARVAAYLLAHHHAMGNVMVIRARAALEARALLTPEQRKLVAPHGTPPARP